MMTATTSAESSSRTMTSPRVDHRQQALADTLQQQRPFNNTTATTKKKKLKEEGTVVMQVRGEMGNHLQKIAHGYGIHWYAQDELEFLPSLKLRHLKKTKWKTARNDIVQCFKQLRNLDYESGHAPDFVKLQKEQAAWLSQQPPDVVSAMYQIRDESLHNISQGIQAMKHLAKTALSKDSKPPHMMGYPIVVLGGPMRNALVDHYYDRYRDLFAFDDKACCAQLPEPDETVFVSNSVYWLPFRRCGIL
jgi:hypothetical protein